MTQDELEDQIWLAILRRSRLGEGPLFDLQELCESESLKATSDQLLEFIKTYRGQFGSSEMTTFSAIRFEVSGEGIRLAKAIEKANLPVTFWDRIADDKFQKIGNLSISLLSFLVSIGALAVAIFALNGTN